MSLLKASTIGTDEKQRQAERWQGGGVGLRK